jgi:hypothetical protein
MQERLERSKHETRERIMGTAIKLSINAEMHSSYHAEAKCVRFWAEAHGIETDGFHASESKARKALADKCAEALKAHAASAKNRRTTLISCADGHVIVLAWDGSGWSYSIASGARSYGSAVIMNADDWNLAHDAAKRHADQFYGGVAWECDI